MKAIGLIGGMSWESSLGYYKIMNEKVRAELGGLHSAKMILYSVDFEEIQLLQHQERWDDLTVIMTEAAKSLEKAGAEILVIGTNTMHKMADDIEKKSGLPLIHIADTAAEVIKEKGLTKTGLLGTKFTMEQAFYKNRLIERHGLDVITPNNSDREIVHSIIYHELCLGKINQSSKKAFLNIIDKVIGEGAESIILGCTEIPLLIKQEDVRVPVLDTTRIHAERAVMEAIY